MKKSLLLLIWMISACLCRAQTFAEFFAQKKTQIKYLVDQIAAYRVYMGYLEKGYDIAEKGLATIDDIRHGEFNLHNGFFNSLKMVRPEIAKYSKVGDIIFYQLAIIKNFKTILEIKNMTAAEMNYLARVYENMESECLAALGDLVDLTTDRIYEMTDGERIKRIDDIWRDMKDKYAFAASFTGGAQLLSARRRAESDDINMSLINNGIK